MKNEFGYILVDSTSQAIRIEKVLNGQNICCKLVPVPRHLSSDCGVCVRILIKELTKIKVLITDQNLGFQTIEVV